MSKFIGKGAVVNNPHLLTHNKQCVVEKYDRSEKKYKVTFDGGWCGWYKLKDLNFDIK